LLSLLISLINKIMNKKILMKTSAVLASLALILGWSVLPAFAESGSNGGDDAVTTNISSDNGESNIDNTSSDLLPSETFSGEGSTIVSEGGSGETTSLTDEVGGSGDSGELIGGDESSTTTEGMTGETTTAEGVVYGSDDGMTSNSSDSI